VAQNDTFQRELSAAAREMSVEVSSQHTMDTAVQIATRIIPGCDLAGISLAHPRGIDTPSASSDVLRRADELQYELREGPSLDALTEQETVVSSNLSTDERWPRWGPNMVAETGMHSIMSYRLFVTKETLGALSVYGAKATAFDSEALHEGLALAAHVAVALVSAQHADHLHVALDARTLIGQASGILMERFSLTPDQAFHLLTRLSQQQNIKLRLLAKEVVLTGRMAGLPDH
jgi:transcriptional regulator with GAF, ATPase, and Fis domain